MAFGTRAFSPATLTDWTPCSRHCRRPSIVLDDYARFLYHIGERSLPHVFVRVAAALRRGDADKMLAKSNTVFTLEVLLQRYLYGRPMEVKRDEGLPRVR